MIGPRWADAFHRPDPFPSPALSPRRRDDEARAPLETPNGAADCAGCCKVCDKVCCCNLVVQTNCCWNTTPGYCDCSGVGEARPAGVGPTALAREEMLKVGGTTV